MTGSLCQHAESQPGIVHFAEGKIENGVYFIKIPTRLASQTGAMCLVCMWTHIAHGDMQLQCRFGGMQLRPFAEHPPETDVVQ